jgi:hypothetical protein
MNCAHVQQRLVDFLYDEMPAEARDELKKHLNTCADCKAIIADYERALGSARAALGGPLAQEPPARVHLAIMEAAKAAVNVTPARAKARPAADEPGFLARLWRTPWLLPAFGAASVATAVFLVRVLKNPEVIPGQNPHSIEERSLATPETLPPPEPTRARQPAAAAEAAAQAKSKSNFDETKTTGSVSGADKYSAQGRVARAESSPPPIRSKKLLVDGPLARPNLGEGQPGDGAPNRFAQPLLAPGGAKTAQVAIDDLDGLPRMTAGPARKAPVPAAVHAVRPMRDNPAASTTGALAPSATPLAAASEVSAENDNSVAAKDRKGRGRDKAGLSLDESIRKAERLYADEDWIAAAQAYRDLLRRLPSHKDTTKWRDRMNESNAAYVRALEAKRKKSLSDDPLNRSKL